MQMCLRVVLLLFPPIITETTPLLKRKKGSQRQGRYTEQSTTHCSAACVRASNLYQAGVSHCFLSDKSTKMAFIMLCSMNCQVWINTTHVIGIPAKGLFILGAADQWEGGTFFYHVQCLVSCCLINKLLECDSQIPNLCPKNDRVLSNTLRVLWL